MSLLENSVQKLVIHIRVIMDTTPSRFWLWLCGSVRKNVWVTKLVDSMTSHLMKVASNDLKSHKFET